MKALKEGTCSLCGNPYNNWGNSPIPLKSYHERCCDNCNFTKVIPARMGLIRQIKADKNGEEC